MDVGVGLAGLPVCAAYCRCWEVHLTPLYCLPFPVALFPLPCSSFQVQFDNPPYSRGIRQRLAKAANESDWLNKHKIVVGE